MNNPKVVTDRSLEYYDGKLKGYIKELYGSDMTVEWEPMEDGKNPFKLKIALKNGNGSEIFAKIVDFPLEQTIVSGAYKSENKSLILYFQDGTHTEIPIEELVEGLASKLDLEGKANIGSRVTDYSRSCNKRLPENTLPYIEINKLGGYSYKDGDSLKTAMVTAVKSVGKNLLNQEKILEQSGAIFNEEGYYCGGAHIIRHGINNARTLPNGGYKFNTQYIVGYICYADRPTNGVQFGIEYTDGSIEYKGTVNNLDSRKTVFTTKANKTVYSIWATYGADNTCYIKDLFMYEGMDDDEYTPYLEHILEIPQAIRNLEGYGESNPDDSNEYNYIDFKRGKFISLGRIVNGAWDKYSTKKETDISYILGGSNILKVGEGGTITVVNESDCEVPIEITYYCGSNDFLGANQIVGDLKGIASIAEYYCDNGKKSERSIGEVLNSLLAARSPLKITGSSLGVLANQQELKGVRVGIIANPPVSRENIIIDKYLDGDAAYLCFWVVSDVKGGESDAIMDLYGAGNIYVGGGSASVADRAISDGEGNNIVLTYARKNDVSASLELQKSRIDALISGKSIAGKAESDAQGQAIHIAYAKNTRVQEIEEEQRSISVEFHEIKGLIGCSIETSWEPLENGVNPYKLNIILKDVNGKVLSTAQIDLPLEQMVVGAEYDENAKSIVLHTPGSTVPVPVSDIFKGLVTDSNILNKKAGSAVEAERALKSVSYIRTDGSTANIESLENKVKAASEIANQSLAAAAEAKALADAFDESKANQVELDVLSQAQADLEGSLKDGNIRVHTARYAPGNTLHTLDNALRNVTYSQGKLSFLRFNAESKEINLLTDDFISSIATALSQNTTFINLVVDAVMREMGYPVNN